MDTREPLDAAWKINHPETDEASAESSGANCSTQNIPFCCPVCRGNGLVPGGFYTKTGDTWTSSVSAETCRSCNGTGIVWGR